MSETTERQKVLVEGGLFDGYRQGDEPLFSVDVEDDGRVLIQLHGAYICRHRPLGYRWRGFKTVTRWRLCHPVAYLRARRRINAVI